MHGPGHLTAAHRVEAYSIVELKTIVATKDAILKIMNCLTVLAHRMWSCAAPVARLLYLTYSTNHENRAKIQSLTAPRPAGDLFHADTNVPQFVILTNVCPAC
jgi:hypothetical protein